MGRLRRTQTAAAWLQDSRASDPQWLHVGANEQGLWAGADLVDDEWVHLPSPAEVDASEAAERRELDAHWAQVAATPWHRRNLRNVEELLTPPISRWGRAVYYVAVPLAIAIALLSSLALFLLR